MKTLNLIIAFVFITTIALAQTNDQQARQKYQEAKEAYEKQDYVKTVQLLLKTNELLGKTNVRIQPLLIKALTQVPAWQFVQEEIDRYKALNPDPSLVEYEEIMSIEQQVDSYIKMETDVYKSIEASPSISACNSYLSTYPHGIYRDDVSWLYAKTSNTLESYYNYIDTYPKGKYINTVNQKIHYSDSLWYAEALEKSTVEAFQNYLKFSPRGEHRDESFNKIEEIKEEKFYRNAISTGNPSEYMKEYPQKRKEEMSALMEEYYYKRVLETYEEKDYRECSELSVRYLYHFSFKKYYSEVYKLYRKSTKKRYE